MTLLVVNEMMKWEGGKAILAHFWIFHFKQEVGLQV